MKRVDAKQRGSIADDGVRRAITHFAERVAHDLNNIISPLLAYPDILIPILPDDKSVTMVRGMQDSAQRAHDVMQLLTALAGGGTQEAETFDVSEIVSQALAAAKGQLDDARGITVEEELASNLLIKMEREAFVRAFEAVLENAIVALMHKDAGGTISVNTKTVRMDAPQQGVGDELIPSGIYHVLTVADTGIGISDEDLPHIVEPFVSKFPQKRGCGGGLGLSVAYCGLRRNGAYMQISSTVGSGTKVNLYFSSVNTPTDTVIPDADTSSSVLHEQLDDRSEPGSDSQESPAAESDTSTQRILVVDDEKSITELFTMILENFIPGVTVDRASNGAEALEKLESMSYPVVVMDLHMPVMDGQEAYFKIKKYCHEHDRKMPAIVFCTGYAPQAALRDEVAEAPGHTLLNKPVQSNLLVEAVRERLPSGLGV